MRKTFLTFCVAALSLLAVSSCGKIWDEFDVVHGELDDLKAKVEALEKKLNDEVAALNTKIGALETAYKAADADLLKKLQEGDAALAASITSLTAKLDALDGEVDGYVKSSEEAIAAAIAQYQADLKKLGDELSAADKLLAEADADILKQLTSVGVTKVSKNDAGNVVITFTDGTTLEVGAYDANANNTGVVTVVVDEDGVKYWAVVLEDGTVESLEVPVGHNELEFKVDEDGALLFSVDGGDTWNETGAYVAEDADSLIDFYQGETDEIDWETYQYIKEDFYTLVFGGETYYLPIYKVDNSVVTIKAGKTYFEYGETITVDVVLSDITSVYVMSKPDGWRASLEGKKLTVTAPAAEAVEAGYAEADGEILLHCTTVEGKCKIAKFAVATSDGFSFTLGEDGSIKIVNPEVVTVTNMWGDTMTDFNDAYVGLATIADFEKDPIGYVTAIGNYEYYGEDMYYMVSNWKMNTSDYDPETYEPIYKVGGAYVPGVYEVDVIETTVAEMYADWTWGSEMPRGSQFVVWACPVDEQGMPRVDELAYGYYAPIDVEATVVGEPSFNDVTVSIALYGANSYYVGKVAKENTADYFTGEYNLWGYISNGLQGLGYGYNSLGMEVSESGVAEYNLSEIVIADMEMPAKLAPATEYYLYIVPVIAGKEFSEYTIEDVFVYEYKTNALVSGGSASVSFSNENLQYTRIEVDVTGTEGTSMIYYAFYNVDDFNEMTEEEVAADLIAYGTPSEGTSTTARLVNNVSPGNQYILASMAVDEIGQYGAVESDTYKAKELVFSETFKAAAGTPVFVANGVNYTVTIPVTVEGGTAAKYHYYWNYRARTEDDLKLLPLGPEAYYSYYTVDAIPELTYYSSQASYQFAVVVESTTGEFSAPVIITVEKPAEETPAE